jgi:hypothetical protein
MLIKNEYGQFPRTTCYGCGVTREPDYTRLFNMGTVNSPIIVDVCNPCLDLSNGVQEALQEMHDETHVTFTDQTSAPVQSGVIPAKAKFRTAINTALTCLTFFMVGVMFDLMVLVDRDEMVAVAVRFWGRFV